MNNHKKNGGRGDQSQPQSRSIRPVSISSLESSVNLSKLNSTDTQNWKEPLPELERETGAKEQIVNRVLKPLPKMTRSTAGIAATRSADSTSCQRGQGQQGPSFASGGNAKWCDRFERVSYKAKHNLTKQLGNRTPRYLPN